MMACLYKDRICQSILRMIFHERVSSTMLNCIKRHSLLLICTQHSITIVFASKIIRSVVKLSGRKCYILEQLGIRISMKILNLCEKQKIGNVVTSSHLYALVLLTPLEKNSIRSSAGIEADTSYWCSASTIWMWVMSHEGFHLYAERVIPLLSSIQNEEFVR